MVISLYESVFLGFFWYTMLLLIRPFFGRWKWKYLNEKTDVSVTLLLRLAGFVFLFSYTAALLDSASVAPDGPAYIREKIFGEYGFYFWIRVITFFGLSQLFWFRQVRESKWVRNFISLCLLFVLSIDTLSLLYFMTQIELMSTRDTFQIYFEPIRFAVIGGIIKLIVFVILVAVMNAMRTRRTNQVTKAGRADDLI
ncbi:MAG TPA: hypothetical protein DIW47_03745 [Bacteroidetes bacterium]|nr:hypothetical protein [Bacteroidota bacterium]